MKRKNDDIFRFQKITDGQIDLATHKIDAAVPSETDKFTKLDHILNSLLHARWPVAELISRKIHCFTTDKHVLVPKMTRFGDTFPT